MHKEKAIIYQLITDQMVWFYDFIEHLEGPFPVPVVRARKTNFPHH